VGFIDDSDKGYDVKYTLGGQLFVWNKVKYDININKHEITFEEAATVFMTEGTEYYYDELHSDEEDRFIALGISKRNNLLIVCHCIRENETVIRIISARKAEKDKQKQKRRRR
jgi:uncharacterized DUF497 family protein